MKKGTAGNFVLYLVVTLVEHHMMYVSLVRLANDGLVPNHVVFSGHFWQLEHSAPVQGMFGWQLDTIGLHHPLQRIRRFLVEIVIGFEEMKTSRTRS